MKVYTGCTITLDVADSRLVHTDDERRSLTYWRDLGDKVVKSIRRHVDGLNDCLLILHTECGFCGSVWEGDSERPECCEAAQAEWDASHAKVTG